MNNKYGDLSKFDEYCAAQYKHFYQSGQEKNHELMYTTFIKRFEGLGEYYHKRALEIFLIEHLTLREITFPQLIQFLTKINRQVCKEVRQWKEMKRVKPLTSPIVCKTITPNFGFGKDYHKHKNRYTQCIDCAHRKRKIFQEKLDGNLHAIYVNVYILKISSHIYIRQKIKVRHEWSKKIDWTI